MRVQSILFLSLFISSILSSSAQNDKFLVAGAGHCADCQDNNFKLNQAFSGLLVSVDCKLKNGDMKRFAVAPLNDDGQFHVSIPGEIVHDGGKSLKHDCYAQLHSAAAVPCPAIDPLGAKIVFKSAKNGNYVFAPNKKLGFTAALCTSKFLWPHFKYPPLPKTHPWLKNFGHPWLHKPIFPPIYKHPFFKPPVPVYTPPVVQPQPPPVPVYKPPVPIYKPPVPVYKPPVPIYKPPVPVYKPPKKAPCPPKPKLKPPVIIKPPKKPCPPKVKPPVVVKPLPPPVPIVKPLPPPVPIVKPLPPPVPIVKPPIFKKPCPPLPPFPKFPPKNYFKHPLLPPLPKLPPKNYFKHPLLPPLPKLPPKYYFKHPKLGNLPKLPPLTPHFP